MDNNLQNFSKHVPQILRQQLLLKLSKKFLNESHEEWDQSEIRTPSIQRFRGALLFVDISGFTVLSQRLDIESLKNHINDYFTKMLAIVDKWGGDVVKFAGDALFIIWHSQILDFEEHSPQEDADTSGKNSNHSPSHNTTNNTTRNKADALMSEAAERAVACALEICSSCGHYEVKLQNAGLDAHIHMFDRFMPQRKNSSMNSGKVAPLDNIHNFKNHNYRNNYNSNANKNNNSNNNDENNVTYLDVHCGISMGLMAGIDIGYGDRWEYFLAGHPLSDVAAAEEKAKKGDVVVSSFLHNLVHGEQSAGAVDIEGNTILPCGCALLAEDYCRVKKVDTKPPKKARKNRLKARKEGFQAIAYENSRIIEDTTHDMEMLFIALSPIFRKMYQSLQTNNTSSPRNTLMAAKSDKESTSLMPARRTRDRRNDQLAAFINMELKRTYYASISKVLTDDLARHVHDAVRSDYEFNDVSGCEDFWDTANVLLARQTGNTNMVNSSNHPNSAGRAMLQVEDGNNSNTDSPSHTNHVVSPTSAHATGHRKSISHQLGNNNMNAANSNLNSASNQNVTAAQLAVSSEILTSNAEVRSVTVMFIKIDTINLHILVDVDEYVESESNRENKDPISQENDGSENPTKPNNNSYNITHNNNNMSGHNNSTNQHFKSHKHDVPDDEHNKVFGFLVRSEAEIASDTALLQQIQGCFGILHHAIYGNGGQLRQFIVDDKGTVCIATFGLRGAVSVDNAASAIETAHQIITALPSLSLSASIGITTGKAYCGLVGSPLRHEYAVMGPSTNLSARLMCKAAANSVICDEDTMRRDRLHEYQPLAEITAKGYSNPVKIFRPAFQGMLPETIKPSPANNHPFFSSNNNSNNNNHSNSNGNNPYNSNNNSSINNSHSHNHHSATSNSATHLTLKVAARQVVKGRKDTRFSSIYTYLMRKMHLDWILSNRSKWELEIRDMINSPFFYENEFNKAQRKSISETSVSIHNNNNYNSNNNSVSYHGNSNHNGGATNSFHGIPTPIRKLHGRKKEVKRILTALLPPLQASGNVMFGFENPAQMVVISGGMGSGKTAVLSAIARKIQFMAERDRCLNVFIARKKSTTMKSKVPFSFWKPMVISLITLFTKDTTATSLPTTGRGGVGGSGGAGGMNAGSGHARHTHSHNVHHGHGGGTGGSGGLSNVNLKKVIICLDKMLKIYSREQLPTRDLLIKMLMSDDDMIFNSSEIKSSDLANVAEAFATLIDFMPNLANRFIIIFIEDVHFLDPWSLRVMLLIWQKATGISLLATYDSDQTPTDESHSFDHVQLHRLVHQPSRLLLSNNSSSNLFNNNNNLSNSNLYNNNNAFNSNSNNNVKDKESSMFRLFNDLKRFAIVDLPPLDKDSTIKVAKEALSDVGIIATDSDLAKLYDISGGNPLYTIELTKALQTIHNQTHAARSLEENNNNLLTNNPNNSNANVNNNGNGSNNGNSDIKADLNELFNMNSRVEEVICYRFDKLTTAQQLVLKAASIAVSNGRNFTAEMIMFLLEESDQFSVASDLLPNRAHGGLAAHLGTNNNPNNNNSSSISPNNNTTATGWLNSHPQGINRYEIAHDSNSSNNPNNPNNNTNNNSNNSQHHEAVDRILLHLVHHHDFIKLIQTHDRSGAHQGKQYNFTIPLEQTSIYQLVIDEQKQWFHERMAMYCRQSAIRRKNDAIDDRLADLKEEAFHWEHATSWGNALKALMFCATCERQRGNEIAWLQHLQSCYGLYKQMEQDMFVGGTLNPVAEDKLPYETEILCAILAQQAKLPQSYHNYNTSNNINSNVNTTTSTNNIDHINYNMLTGDYNVPGEETFPLNNNSGKPSLKKSTIDDKVVSYLRTLDREMSYMFESFSEVDDDVSTMIFYLHVSLADAYILAWEDMKILLQTLGVCLRLCIAAKYCEVFPGKTRALQRQKYNNYNNTNFNTNTMMSVTSHNSNNSNNTHVNSSNNHNNNCNTLFLASASRDEYETSSKYSVKKASALMNNNNAFNTTNNHRIHGIYHFSIPAEYVQHFLSTLCLSYYTSLQYVSRKERDVFGAMKLMCIPELLLAQTVATTPTTLIRSTLATEQGNDQDVTAMSSNGDLQVPAMCVGDEVQNLVLQTLYYQHHGDFETAYRLWQEKSPTLRYNDLEIAIESSKLRLMQFGMDASIFVTGQFMQWLALSGKDPLTFNNVNTITNRSHHQNYNTVCYFEGDTFHDITSFGNHDIHNNDSALLPDNFIRTEVLNAFYHIPHVASLEYLTIFALPACVFNDDYDTAIQCRAHYRHAIQQYAEQVEVSSPALKQVLIMWARAGMVVYQYADQFALYSQNQSSNNVNMDMNSNNINNSMNNNNNVNVIQQQVEIFDVEAARAEDLFSAIDTAEFLNRAKMTGSNDVITLLTLQCMVARGMCLNSLVLQMLCALLMLTPHSNNNHHNNMNNNMNNSDNGVATQQQDLAIIDELFEKWFNRLVHTMVLATHFQHKPIATHQHYHPSNPSMHAVSQDTEESIPKEHNATAAVPADTVDKQQGSVDATGVSQTHTLAPNANNTINNDTDNNNNNNEDSLSMSRFEDNITNSERSVNFCASNITNPRLSSSMDITAKSIASDSDKQLLFNHDVTSDKLFFSTSNNNNSSSNDIIDTNPNMETHMLINHHQSSMEQLTELKDDNQNVTVVQDDQQLALLLPDSPVIQGDESIDFNSNNNNTNKNSSYHTAPRLLGSGLGESGSGAWNILNILNPLSLLAKVLDQRAMENISLQIPLTMHVVRAFLSQHAPRLLQELHAQELLGAEHSLQWLMDRIVSLDETRLTTSASPHYNNHNNNHISNKDENETHACQKVPMQSQHQETHAHNEFSLL